MAGMGGGGTLGLVNDLSVKLAKQRKQLNALVKEVKSSADKQITWRGYLWRLVLNDICIMLVGFIVGMMLLGVSPTQGSFTASKVQATGLTVRPDQGASEVSVAAPAGTSEVAIQSSELSVMELAGFDDRESYRFAAPTAELLQLTHGGDVRFEVDGTGVASNGTDVKMQGKSVVIGANLALDGETISAINSSLTFAPGLDSYIYMAPSGGGRVHVDGPTHVVSDDPTQGGSLKIGADGDTYTLHAMRELPKHQILDMSGEVTIGHRAQDAKLRVWGTSNVSDDLTIDGNLIIHDGNMNLGSASVVCGSPVTPGDLSIGGDTFFGRFANDTLETPATVRVLNGSDYELLKVEPITGNMVSKGKLIVEQAAAYGYNDYSDIASSVMLGSKLEHSVDIQAATTSLVNMNATGNAQLGAEDSDEVVIFGDLHQSINRTTLTSVDGETGDVYANVSLFVTKDTNLRGSVELGERAWAAGGDNFSLAVSHSSEFSAPVHLNRTLRVDGSSTLGAVEVGVCEPDDPDTPHDEFAACSGRLQSCGSGGDDCATTMRGILTIFDGLNTILTVQPESGDIDMVGEMEFGRDATLQANASIGTQDTTITAAGDVTMHAPLHSYKDLRAMSDVTVDGELEVRSHATVSETLRVAGDSYLGSLVTREAADEVHVYGDMLVTAEGERAFEIDASARNMHTDGRLTVQGQTTLLESSSINNSVTVNGRAQFGAQLRVSLGASVLDDVGISGETRIRQDMTIGANMTVDGDALLASLGNTVEAHGTVLVTGGAGAPLLTVTPGLGAAVVGDFVVQSPVSFSDHVDIGSPVPGRGLTVLSTSYMEAPVTMGRAATVQGDLTVRDDATATSMLSTSGDVTLGSADAPGYPTAATVKGPIRLKDDTGTTIASIMHASGDFEMTGTLSIGGDMIIDGQMVSPEFSADLVTADDIDEITGSDNGVTIEGVLLRDGAIERTKVNEMVELIAEKGVTLESSTCKAGAMVLRAEALTGATTVDMLTLTNHNHQFEMGNVTTGIDFDQYYHHSQGANADGSAPVASAARVAMMTAESWTESPTTLNSHMVFETAFRGIRAERARLTPEGDFILGATNIRGPPKMTMDSELGDVTIVGDVLVGDDAAHNSGANRTLEIRSEAQASRLLLEAGGMEDSSVSLNIETGAEMTIRNVNYESRDRSYQDRPTLVINDQAADIMTLDSRGDMWVSGSALVGDYDPDRVYPLGPGDAPYPHPDSLLHLESSGATSLHATAGISHDAVVSIVSGPNSDASLRLVDPADSSASSTFVITNDGDAPNATLVVSDGVNSMVTIQDQGDVGLTQFHGDFTTSSTGDVPRILRIESTQAATLSVETGSSSIADASVVVRAGPNMDARLDMLDPNGLRDAPGFDARNVFSVVNVGVVEQVAWTDEERTVSAQQSILAFQNGELLDPLDPDAPPTPITVMAIDDVGGVANLRNTGNGQFGVLPVEADPDDPSSVAVAGTQVPVTLRVESAATAMAALTAGCSDDGECFGGSIELLSGDDQNSALVLGSEILVYENDGFGDYNVETIVPSAIRMFNVGAPEAAAEDTIQSLWASENPTLRTTYTVDGGVYAGEEHKIMQIVDQGSYGDLAVSGNGVVYGAGQRGIQIGYESGAEPSYLNVVSGQTDDAVIRIQTEPDERPGLTLQDTSETQLATFTLRNEGSFATPRFQIVDKDASSLMEVRTVCRWHSTDPKCVGDLYASGDVVFGSPDSTEPRSVTIGADAAAEVKIEAGISDDAELRLVAGEDKLARLMIGPRTNTTDEDLRIADPMVGNYEIARITDVDGVATNILEVSYSGSPMFSVTDIEKSATQSVGNLGITGDVTIGGADLDARTVTVASMSVASFSVRSGDFDDAEVALIAANGQDASLTLESSSALEVDPDDPDAPVAMDNIFEIFLDGDAPGDPVMKFGDGTGDLISVTDAGSVGNLEVTGNGLFGSGMEPFASGALTALDTEMSIMAPQTASIDIIGEEDAELRIVAGYPQMNEPLPMSHFTLTARPEKASGGHLVSAYVLTNHDQYLTLQDSAHVNTTVLQLTDQGDTGKLEFAGDVTISTVDQQITVPHPSTGLPTLVDAPVTVDVSSNAHSQLAVQSGNSAPAVLSLTSGDNMVSSMTLSSRTDTTVGGTVLTTYKDFAFMNDGTAATPQFQITDGTSAIFTIQENLGQSLVSLPGTLACDNLISQTTTLGSGLDSEVVINAHISSPSISFDSNADGIMLDIRFEDPAAPTTIIIPDESGTVMTTATPYSQLSQVSNLASGQIAEGFGTITTSNEIYTSTDMASDGLVRVESAFRAFSDISIGDDEEDEVHFRGVVQNNVRFIGDGCGTTAGCEKGMLFHASLAQLQSSANIGTGTAGKQTLLRGHFDSDSLLGERQIMIPDVPMGGMLMVNDNKQEVAEASNVHQVRAQAKRDSSSLHSQPLALASSSSQEASA